MRKNLPIEFLRFVFMTILCIWHSGVTIVHHGYLAVEFFAILSGFFIEVSVRKATALSPFLFTMKRIKHFLPVIVVTIIPSLFIGIKDPKLNATINTIIPIPIYDNGIFGSVYNAPLWYIGCLITGGYFIYALSLNFNRAYSSIIFAALPLLVYTFIFQGHIGESIEHRGFGIIGPFYMPLWRIMAGLSVGICLHRMLFTHSHWFENHTILVNIALLSSMAALAALFYFPQYLDQYSLLIFVVLIAAAFIQKSLLSILFQSKIWGFLGGLTLYMLFVHRPIKTFVKYYIVDTNSSYYIIIYLSVVLIVSVVVKYICEYLEKKIVPRIL